MKRLLLLLFSVMAMPVLMAACGGGSSTPPPPPTGNFSNASLNGQYAFSMSGVDLNGGYIARAGSFFADGQGTISAALEDLVSASSGTGEVSFTGGTYTIESNGRGLLVLQGTNNSGLQLNIALNSTSQGVMIQTDLQATSSGTFALQSPSEFNNNALNGNYVFDFSGFSFSTNVAPFSTIGQFALNGNGTLTGGTIDEHDGNASGPSGAMALEPGTYQLDTSGNGATYGRGTLSFDGRTFVYYIVDHTRFKVIEEDTAAATLGDAILQSASIPTQNSGFSGSFVYLVGGSSVLGSEGTDARVARFTADGSGGIGAVSYDENNDGSTTHISQGSNISKATYAIDTANAGSGRGTFTFTASNGGTYSYVFYLISSTQAVLQDASAGIIADGPMQAQTGAPFSNATIAGNYAFNWSGVQLGSQNAIPFEEDFVGQYVLATTTSTNISGVMDYTELGLSGQQLYPNTSLAGALTIVSDGTVNNTIRVVNGNSPSTTYNFVVYIVSANTAYMLVTDKTRVTAGIASQQTP